MIRDILRSLTARGWLEAAAAMLVFGLLLAALEAWTLIASAVVAP